MLVGMSTRTRADWFFLLQECSAKNSMGFRYGYELHHLLNFLEILLDLVSAMLALCQKINLEIGLGDKCEKMV